MNTADDLTPQQRHAITGPISELLDTMQEVGGALDSESAQTYAARSLLGMGAMFVFARLGIQPDKHDMLILNEWAHRAMDQVALLGLASGKASSADVEVPGEIAEPPAGGVS